MRAFGFRKTSGIPGHSRWIKELPPGAAGSINPAMAKDPSDDSNSIAVVTAQIIVLRAQRVMIDSMLAALYGTSTERLNEQVRRNSARFPDDFVFQLAPDEVPALMRSQVATASMHLRNARFRPYAFTEHGAIMAATVLNTPRAIDMSS